MPNLLISFSCGEACARLSGIQRLSSGAKTRTNSPLRITMSEKQPIPSIFDGPRYSRALLHLRAIATNSCVQTEGDALQGGVSDELRSQNLSFSLATQVGRRPATSVQVESDCWGVQNAAP